MDGAQTVNIPLDSGLDINAHDMLVDINNPLFLHNRQKYSGRCLPSSVRFEHDGWAAGNHVYNYSISTRTVDTSPAGFTISYNLISSTGPVYILNVVNDAGITVGTITIIRESAVGNNAGVITMTDTDNYVTLSGTLNGKSIHIIFDSITRTLRSGASHDQAITYTYSVARSGMLTLNVVDTTDTTNIQLDAVYVAGDGTLGADQVVPYAQYADGIHTWRSDTVSVQCDSNGNVDFYASAGTSIDVTTRDVSIDNGVLSFDIDILPDVSFTVNATAKSYIYYFLLKDIAYNYKVAILDTSNQLAKWQCTTKGVQGDNVFTSSKYLYKNSQDDSQGQIIDVQIPIWFNIAVRSLGATLVTDYDKPQSTISAVGENYGDVHYLVLKGKVYIAPNRSVAAPTCTMYPDIALQLNEQTITVSKDMYSVNNDDSITLKAVVSHVEDMSFRHHDYAVFTIPLAFAEWLVTYYYNNISQVVYIETSNGAGPGLDYISSGIIFLDALRASVLDSVKKAKTRVDFVDVPLCADLAFTAEWDNSANMPRISAIHNRPSVFSFIDSALAYSETRKDENGNVIKPYGELIPVNIISICRYGMLSKKLTLNSQLGTQSHITSAFIRNGISIENGPTQDGLWYIDRGEYSWFDLGVDISLLGDTPKLTLSLTGNGQRTLYWYNGNSATWVPAIDTTGNARFGVSNALCNEVATITCDLIANGGVNIGPLTKATVTNDTNATGIAAVDACIDRAANIRFTPGAYTGTFEFTNDNHTAGRVAFTQDVTVTLPDGNTQVISNDGYIDDYTWLVPINFSVLDTEFSLTPTNNNGMLYYEATPNISTRFNSKLPRVTDSRYTLSAAIGTDSVTVVDTRNTIMLTYNAGANAAVVSDINGSNGIAIPADAISTVPGGVKINYTYTPQHTYTMYPKQVVSTALPVTSMTTDNVTFTYNDTDYDIDITSSATGLLTYAHKNTMTFNSVDVYDKDSAINDICTVDLTDTYQFVRQAWDCESSTEVFWYIDSNRYLRLSRNSLIRMVKQDTLHDWHGDNWMEDRVWPRYDIIAPDSIQYMCSSAYDSTPYLLVLAVRDANTMTLTAFDTTSDTLANFTITIKVVKVQLGDKLNKTYSGNGNITIYSYDDINIHSLCSKSKLSATRIDDMLIFGIHYNNNFNQWTIAININTIACICIQGYGCVGVNGCLTGGEIPVECFNVAAGGFNTAVQPLSVLESDTVSTDYTDIDKARNIVVGNSSQQWYLFTKLDGIVSHLLYDNGLFKSVLLPITNTYTGAYASGSTAGYNYEIFNIKRASGNDIGDAPQWSKMIAFIGSPGIYYSNPVTVACAYLQQSCVQAAYTHYNSTSLNNTKDIREISEAAKRNPTTDVTLENTLSPLSSDTLSFDSVAVTQHASITAGTPAAPGIQLFLSMLTTSVDSFISKTVGINSTVNMSTSENIARQYGQMYAMNTIAAALSGIQTRSVNPGLTSQVVAMKSLDMFYSTSDAQKVQAGPGFVNHAFVAQCTAQSVTSIQYESYARSITVLYPGLSKIETLPAYVALRTVADSTHNLLIANTASSATGALTFFASPGYLVALALAATMSAAEAVAKTMLDNIESFMSSVEALAAKGPNSSLLGNATTKSYDVEGKHKYGSRSEQFMWPCFDCNDNSILDETVACGMYTTDVILPYKYKRLTAGPGLQSSGIGSVTAPVVKSFDGNTVKLPYYTGMIRGVTTERKLPDGMACAIGTSNFLSTSLFKNENISESEPVFTAPLIHDYVIDARWSLGLTSPGYGSIAWVSCKDTKVIDGEPSNIVVSDSFCGVACAYAAIEIKHGVDSRYVRPFAVTPQAVLFNQTGLNCCADNEVWHACDGYGYRLTSWLGSEGMHKEHMALLYSYIQNERFKLSNKLPPNQLMGNFKTEPVVATQVSSSRDKVYTLLTQPSVGKGLEAGVIGEDKDVIRYAIPIFTEQVQLLPAAVKTYSGYALSVVDGITGLVTDLRTDMHGYKVPVSEDFAISNVLYRVTSEHICKVVNKDGVSTLENMIPVIGLRFLGATPHEAFFYSQSTRQYYVYSGGDRLNAVDTTERFRDIVHGLYDFISQEVVVPALATFSRLDKFVLDDEDETDNVIVPRLKQQQFIGEVWPPLNTIYNTRSWYRLMSLPTGIVYQGPNRCIINQFIVSDYMVPGILRNKGKWQRVPREYYNPIRKYPAIYESVHEQLGDGGVRGWTHNPFLLVTAPLGLNQETDCLFEWVITFCWTVEMDKIIGPNEYVCVNITSETMSPGGKKVAERPTHVFLCKELFTRSDNYGYYSFRFSGQTGAGNRERLHIWSDGYIAVSAINMEYKPITTRRNEILTQQVDVIGRLAEM